MASFDPRTSSHTKISRIDKSARRLRTKPLSGLQGNTENVERGLTGLSGDRLRRRTSRVADMLLVCYHFEADTGIS